MQTGDLCTGRIRMWVYYTHGSCSVLHCSSFQNIAWRHWVRSVSICFSEEKEDAAITFHRQILVRLCSILRRFDYNCLLAHDKWRCCFRRIGLFSGYMIGYLNGATEFIKLKHDLKDTLHTSSKAKFSGFINTTRFCILYQIDRT